MKAPVLYRQVRVGRGNREFQVLKFRSMATCAEADGVARWATEDDARVTRVGSLMRKTRVDELPQLFNVLDRVGDSQEKRWLAAQERPVPGLEYSKVTPASDK